MKLNRRSYTWPIEPEPKREWFFQLFDALEAVATFVRGRHRP